MIKEEKFSRISTVTHDSKVIVFGEAKSNKKLFYKILDLEQVDDKDNPNSWDDNTHWTNWLPVPYPDELRSVTLNMVTVAQKVDHAEGDVLKHWQVISDGQDLYLLRACDISQNAAWKPGAESTEAGKGKSTSKVAPNNVRIYVNRYIMIRDVSPNAATNKSA
ncbi:MAG: hypothetical protein AAGD96_31800, partial [Chloroflexota bacterium]